MGKQKGLYLKGKSGKILYYSWKGIPCQKLIPEEVYQSTVVIRHKKANGLSTTMGAGFRSLLAEALPYPKDKKMQTGVRIALLKWLKQEADTSQLPAGITSFFNGLNFNEEADLQRCLQVPLTISLARPNELALNVPAFIPAEAIEAPPNTYNLLCKVMAACCDIATGAPINNYTASISIPYNYVTIPTQTIPLPLNMPDGSLTIIATALRYYTWFNGTFTLINKERFLPSQVVGAMSR